MSATTISTSPEREPAEYDFVVREVRLPGERALHSQGALDVPPADALAERVRRELLATGHLPLRNVDVKIDSGDVRLEGAVARYYLKQLAQSAALRVPGVARVVNAIEVISVQSLPLTGRRK
jgi:hypothetical protein